MTEPKVGSRKDMKRRENLQKKTKKIKAASLIEFYFGQRNEIRFES